MIKVDATAKGSKVTVEGSGIVVLTDLANAIEGVLRCFAELGLKPYEKTVQMIELIFDEACAHVEDEYGFYGEHHDDEIEDDEEEEDEKPVLSSDQAELFFKLAKAIFEQNHPEKKKEED